MRIERVAGAWHVPTPAGRVRAARALVACNGYVDDLVPGVGRHVLPINSYVVATAPLGERGRALLPENDAVADTRFVIDYFRLSDDGRLVFGGGESCGHRFPADPARGDADLPDFVVRRSRRQGRTSGFRLISRRPRRG